MKGPVLYLLLVFVAVIVAQTEIPSDEDIDEERLVIMLFDDDQSPETIQRLLNLARKRDYPALRRLPYGRRKPQMNYYSGPAMQEYNQDFRYKPFQHFMPVYDRYQQSNPHMHAPRFQPMTVQHSQEDDWPEKARDDEEENVEEEIKETQEQVVKEEVSQTVVELPIQEETAPAVKAPVETAPMETATVETALVKTAPVETDAPESTDKSDFEKNIRNVKNLG